MPDRQHRERLPITSRVWFFPVLILLTPLLSRACMVGLSSKPRPAAPSSEQICAQEYNQCLKLCGAAADCEQTCVDELELCLTIGSSSPPSPYPSDEPYYEDGDYEWSCGSSSEDYDASGWDCGFSESSDDYSGDGGGFDCSADNYDEGDSEGDGEGDWGEDWGERSPAGGDGIHSPADLPG